MKRHEGFDCTPEEAIEHLEAPQEMVHRASLATEPAEFTAATAATTPADYELSNRDGLVVLQAVNGQLLPMAGVD